jgi:hypothetical protein
MPGLEPGAPGDRGLGVGKGRHVGLEHHRGAVGGDRHPAGALEDGVEQPAGEHRGALDPADVPGQGGLECQDAVAVDAEGVALRLEQVDLGGEVGQEQVALAAAAHQRHTLPVEGDPEHA